MRPARGGRARGKGHPDEGPAARDRGHLRASFVEWFAYAEVVGRQDEPPRPALTFVIESARRRLQASALFDSGSDRSFLPPELARRLGVMPRRGSLSVEIMGTVVPAGMALASIELPSPSGHLRLDAVDFLVPMPPVDLPFVILGRSPAFEHFEVRFRDWERRFGLLPRRHPQVRAGRELTKRSRSLVARPTPKPVKGWGRP